MVRRRFILALAFLYVLEYLGLVEWLPTWAHGPVIWISFVAVMLAAAIYFEMFSNFLLKKQRSKKTVARKTNRSFVRRLTNR